MQKPSNPQGTRDFGPEIMRKREYILDTIKTVYKKYGFEPIETPSLEKLETLEGKYGEEGDKLLYKIRSNKELAAEVTSEQAEGLKKLLPGAWIAGESKLGLRYDLTVPFARFVCNIVMILHFLFADTKSKMYGGQIDHKKEDLGSLHNAMQIV